MGTNPIGLLGSVSHPNPTTYSSSSRGAVAAARAMAGQFSWPAARELAGGKSSRRWGLGGERERENEREQGGRGWRRPAPPALASPRRRRRPENGRGGQRDGERKKRIGRRRRRKEKNEEEQHE